MSERTIPDNKLDDLDQLCQAIASLRHMHHAVINQYRLLQDEENALKAEVARKYGGPIASESVIERKVADRLALLGNPRKPRSVSGQAMKQRLTFDDKLSLTKAMVDAFAKQGIDRVTLEDINDWLAQPRRKGTEDVRDLLKVRGIHITQARWFEAGTLGDKKALGLLPPAAYDTKGSGAKSTFDVKKWKLHLDGLSKVRNAARHGVRS
jgi:hypothetical protein